MILPIKRFKVLLVQHTLHLLGGRVGFVLGGLGRFAGGVQVLLNLGGGLEFLLGGLHVALGVADGLLGSLLGLLGILDLLQTLCTIISYRGQIHHMSQTAQISIAI